MIASAPFPMFPKQMSFATPSGDQPWTPGPAHGGQRIRSATRARSHQFPIDCDDSTVSKRVIGIYHGGRSRYVKLSRYESVSRFVLAPLNWDIVKCADGLVRRGICARCVWMVASIESPR